MEFVVEITEPGRRAPSIQRFSKAEIVVGRAWTSDLVIVDEEVEPHHLSVQIDNETGRLSLEDLRTANGVRVNGRRLDQSKRTEFGDVITIGQTSFRIHRRSDPVAPVIVRTRAEIFLKSLGHPPLAITLSILAVALQEYVSFLGQSLTFEWEDTLNSALGLATIVVIWGLVWGGIAKLVRHQLRIWSHIGLIATIWIAYIVINELGYLLSFNMLSTTVSETGQAIIQSVLVFAWLFLAMILTINLRTRARIFVATGLVGLFVTSSFIIPRFQAEEFVNYVPLETRTLQPAFLLRATETNAEFLADIDRSLQKTRAFALKERNK